LLYQIQLDAINKGEQLPLKWRKCFEVSSEWLVATPRGRTSSPRLTSATASDFNVTRIGERGSKMAFKNR
jgi:hypothetical protein